MEYEDNISEESNPSPMQQDPSASGLTVFTEKEGKIRRDALGDKVHSEKFVTLYNSTEFLLNLQDLPWNKGWEQQFVNMWDMTKEKEVCDFLYGFNFPHLVAEIVPAYYEECRLMEILMGIINDIAFVFQDEMEVSTDDMQIIFDLFCNSDNVGVLTQVFKFFEHVGHNDTQNGFINRKVWKRVLFILVNNSNCEVLYGMLSCLGPMCADSEFSESIIRKDPFFLKYCVMAYKQVYIEIDEQNDNGDILTLRQYNCFYDLMYIVSYVSSSAPSKQLKATLALASESLLRETSNVFKFLSRDKETIESLLQSVALFYALVGFLSVSHPVSYQGNLFKSLLKIVVNSSKTKLRQNFLLDLVMYFICTTETYEQLKDDCLKVGKRRTLYVLEKFANVKDEWKFRDHILCAKNLHRLSHDLKDLSNK